MDFWVRFDPLVCLLSLFLVLKPPFFLMGIFHLAGETDWGSLVKRPMLRVPDSVRGDLSYGAQTLCSEPLMKMLLRPQLVNLHGTPFQQDSVNNFVKLQDMKGMQSVTHPKIQHPTSSETGSLQNQNHHQPAPTPSDPIDSNSSPKANLPRNVHPSTTIESDPPIGADIDKEKYERDPSTNQTNPLPPAGDCGEEKLTGNDVNMQTFVNHNQIPMQLQQSVSWSMQPQMESLVQHSQPMDIPQPDFTNSNGLYSSLDGGDGCLINPSCLPLAGVMRSPGNLSMLGMQDSIAVFPEALNFPLPSTGQDMWDPLNNIRFSSQTNHLVSFSHQEASNLNCMANANVMRDVSDESNNQSGIYSCSNLEISNGGSTFVDPAVSSTILDDYCTLKDADFPHPSDCLAGNFSSSQDVQSQITSASLGDSQAFSRQEFHDNSGGTSSCNVDFDEGSLLPNGSWKQVAPPMRTYTKVGICYFST